jgi:hypothetical protein
MREQREVRNGSEKERSEGQKLKREEREAETEKRSEGQEMKTARSVRCCCVHESHVESHYAP